MYEVETAQLNLLKEITPSILRDCRQEVIDSILENINNNLIVPEWKAYDLYDSVVLQPIQKGLDRISILNNQIVEVIQLTGDIYSISTEQAKFIVYEPVGNVLNKRIR